MLTKWIAFMTNLVKSSLDNYVLPGTVTGTEILWLYMAQWKRDLSSVTVASLQVLFFDADVSSQEGIESNLMNSQE